MPTENHIFTHKKGKFWASNNIMAKITARIDTRTCDVQGQCPIKLRISANTTSVRVGTNLFIPPSEWDNTQCRAIGKKNEHINRALDALLLEWRGTMASLPNLRRMTALEIKTAIEQRLDPTKIKKGSFAEAYSLFINKKEGRTKEIYLATWKQVEKFAPKCMQLALEEITVKWLEDFDNFVSKTSPAINSRSIHFRNIRAVFNFALDEELTSAYPFRKFKIKTMETQKRSLSADEMRFIFEYKAEEHAQKYIDIFKLIFLLIGINIADLFQLRSLNNGRAEYIRSKTKKLYSVKVEKEAKDLLKQFTADGMINIAPNYATSRDFAKHLNTALQRIGSVRRVSRGGKKEYKPLFPNLTTYWARHSWATIAAELDIPNETIAAALGHSYGNRTTAIYIDFNRKKVDEANRRVIDYVLYGKR